MAEQQHPVSVPSARYSALEALRAMPRALESTRTMREAGTTYLPAFQSEQAGVGRPNSDYDRRVGVSVLFPAFSDAIESLAGKVFSKPIRHGKDAPKKITEWCEDIDTLGANLHEFAKARFQRAWRDGFSLIRVEMPPAVRNPDGTKALITEAQASARRPWLVAHDACSLIGAVFAGKRLVQARLREDVEVADGPYGTKTSKRIRVLFASNVANQYASFEVWEETEDASTKEKTWAILEERSALDGLTEIPLIPVPSGKLGDYGIWDAEPPLLELGYWNVRDWQQQSDLDNIEHVANVPVLVIIGAGDDAKAVTWDSSTGWHLPPEATIAWLEHKGACIGELKNSIETGRNVMRLLALEPLLPRKQEASESTVSDSLRGAKANSVLQSGALALQNALETALQIMAQWTGMGEDAGGSLIVNQRFLLTKEEKAGLEHLMAMRGTGDLSRGTLWKESVRADVLSDDFDPDEEEKALAAEGPATPDEEEERYEVGNLTREERNELLRPSRRPPEAKEVPA